MTSDPLKQSMTATVFRRSFMRLILAAWIVPALFGFSFIIYIELLTPQQVQIILLSPLEPVFIIVSLVIALLYFSRFANPVCAYLEHRNPANRSDMLRRMRRFPLDFWLLFLGYLVIAPFTVIISAEMYTDFAATAVDWFRISQVALTSSIIVGLPIFFMILDTFGKVLGDAPFNRIHVSIKAKVFLIGALVPLLIDTMLVSYFWSRTGFFTTETFVVWLVLELVAIAGSMVFVRSISQSLAPLQSLTRDDEYDLSLETLVPVSTDELGVLTSKYRVILEELCDSEDRWRSLVNSIPGRVSMFGADGVIKYVNRVAEGLTVNGVIGTSVYHYIPEEHRETARQAVSAVLESGEAVTIEVPVKAPAYTRWWSHSISPVLHNGQIADLLSVSTDITERKQYEQALNEHHTIMEELVQARTQALQQSNRELESFSYSVSHDLRAPLRSIDGFSQAVVEDYGDQLGEQGRGYLERVRKAAQHMGGLIDDLLELARLGRTEFKRKEVDFCEIATEVIAGLRQAEPGRSVLFSCEINDKVSADPVLIQLVLQNLIGNAWKYTAREKTAQIELGVQTEGEETIYFVRDNGIGFDMAYSSKLFGVFQRLHREAEFEGTGVGLATVLRIIERHGGRIWAESAPGQGASFLFTV